MNEVYQDLAPLDVYESFLDAKRHFAEQFEAQSEERSQREEAYRAWVARRPGGMHSRILEALNIDREAADRLTADVGAAYREHLEAHPIPQAHQPADFGLPGLPEPGTVAAFPYATVALAEDRAALAMDDTAGFEAGGNPDAWNVSGFTARQPFLMEDSGEGSGMAPGGMMAAYHHTTSRVLSWFFLYMPFGDHPWSCSVSPWFLGQYRCWAESDWPFSDPWACTKLDAVLCLLPFGVPGPRVQDAQYRRETLIDVCGHDVNEWKWGGWLPKLAPLTPLPQHRQKPHWIIFSATGAVGVCGESHAMLDFARGAMSSGSLESGTYRETKYGVYCSTAKIHW